MKSLSYLLVAFGLVFFYACDPDDDSTTDSSAEFTGAAVAVGDGEAWTYVRLDADGEPEALGIQFSDAALDNLPTGSMHADEFMLPMPNGVSIPPYDHATLDWNEHGHEPMMVYDLPHFDFHFYFISPSRRDLITPFDSMEFNRPLPAENLAPMYLETPGGVPRMGAHVIDLMSPEVAGTGPFSHTFIYGKYDGRLNFLEPMITKEMLDKQTSIDQAIRQPATWQERGYYPGRYTLEYDEESGVHSLLLTDLEEF